MSCFFFDCCLIVIVGLLQDFDDLFLSDIEVVIDIVQVNGIEEDEEEEEEDMEFD